MKYRDFRYVIPFLDADGPLTSRPWDSGSSVVPEQRGALPSRWAPMVGVIDPDSDGRSSAVLYTCRDSPILVRDRVVSCGSASAMPLQAHGKIVRPDLIRGTSRESIPEALPSLTPPLSSCRCSRPRSWLDWWISAGLRGVAGGRARGMGRDLRAGPHQLHDTSSYTARRGPWASSTRTSCSDTLGMTAYNLGTQGNNFAIQYTEARGAPLQAQLAAETHRAIGRGRSPSFLKQLQGPAYDPVQFLPYVLDASKARAAQPLPFGTFDFWDRHLPAGPLLRRRAVNTWRSGAPAHDGPPDRVAERDRGYKTLSMPLGRQLGSRARRYWQSQGLEPDRRRDRRCSSVTSASVATRAYRSCL